MRSNNGKKHTAFMVVVIALVVVVAGVLTACGNNNGSGNQQPGGAMTSPDTGQPGNQNGGSAANWNNLVVGWGRLGETLSDTPPATIDDYTYVVIDVNVYIEYIEQTYRSSTYSGEKLTFNGVDNSRYANGSNIQFMVPGGKFSNGEVVGFMPYAKVLLTYNGSTPLFSDSRNVILGYSIAAGGFVGYDQYTALLGKDPV
jgi:hypothetical protein